MYAIRSYYDIVHPITPEARQQIETEILNAFLAEVENKKNEEDVQD